MAHTCWLIVVINSQSEEHGYGYETNDYRIAKSIDEQQNSSSQGSIGSSVAFMVNALMALQVSERGRVFLELPEHFGTISPSNDLWHDILCVPPGQFPVGFSVKPGQRRVGARSRALLLGEVFGIVGLRAVISRCRFIGCHPVVTNTFTQWPAVRQGASGAWASMSRPNYSA